MAIDERHAADRWGLLRTADGVDLVAVADIVRGLCGPVVPVREAGRAVHDRLLGAAVPLYMTQPGDFAFAVTESFVVRPAGWSRPSWSRPAVAVPKLQGRAGALRLMQACWQRAGEPGALDAQAFARCGQFALARADAAVLFPGMLADVPGADGQAAGGAAASLEANYPPAGGAWPHQKGRTWTDAERDAMFQMRHLGAATDDAIAAAAGCKRQIVSQQIGAAQAWKNRDWIGGAQSWKPSTELLAACGLSSPSAPLQVVAIAAVGMVSNAS